MNRESPSDLLEKPRIGAGFALGDHSPLPPAYTHPVVPPVPLPPVEDANLLAGEESLRRGDYERAVSEFTRCILTNPGHTDAYARRAEAWKSLGRYDSAAADLTQVLQANPTDERAAAGRGQLLAFNGRYREAANDYSVAIDRSPTNPGHYLSRGQAYSRLGEFPAAVADFSRAIDLAPGNAVAYLERGTALLNAIGDLGLAASDLSRAIQLNPFLGLAYARRAEVHEKLGKPDLATADLTEAVRLDPTNAFLLAARGEALARAGASAAAQADYSAALRLEPSNPRLWGGLGLLHKAAGRLDEAEHALSEAIRLDAMGVDWLLARADVRFALARHDTAFADYADASRRRPDSGEAHLGQGRVHLAKSDFEMARRSLDKAIELAPKLAEAYFQRAKCFDHFRSPEPALADASRALELKPDYLEARRLRADLLVRTGQADGAYDDLAQLIRQLPRDPLVFFLRGKLEARRERFDSAVNDLTMSLKLDPRNADVRAERGLVYRRLRKNWAALVDLVQAVQNDPKHSAEYMIQRAIVAGARKQYNRALADFAVALQLHPDNATAVRGIEMVLQLRQAAESKSSGGEPASREVMSAANELLGTPDLGVRRPLRPLKKRAAKRTVAKPKPPAPRPAPARPAESVESNVARQMLTPPDIDLADEADIEVKFAPAPPPPRIPSPAPLTGGPKTGTGTMPAMRPGTGTMPAIKTGTNPGTGTFPILKGKGPGAPTTGKSKVEKKAGFFAGLFGGKAKAESGPVVVAGKKPNKQDAEAEKKAKRAKVIGYAKIALIPIALVALSVSLYSELAGPDIEGALARAKAAGYPISATLTAEDLWGQFAKDNAGSNQKYDEQYLEVSGKVKSITKTPAGFTLTTSHATLGIDCRLASPEDLDGIKKGDSVIVQGISGGRAKADQHVVLGQCKIRPK